MLKLKELRKQAGMTQEQLADLVGASKRQIGAWERGENDLPMDYADSIATIFGCTIDDIAGRSPSSPAPRPSAPPAPELTPDEAELVRCFRSMDAQSRDALLLMARNSAALSGVGRTAGERAAGRAVK